MIRTMVRQTRADRMQPQGERVETDFFYPSIAIMLLSSVRLNPSGFTTYVLYPYRGCCLTCKTRCWSGYSSTRT